MVRLSIRILLILAVVAMLGIAFIQVFWLKKAFDLKEIQFNHNVNIVLKNTAQRILNYNNNKTKLINPVNQLADDYYVVMVNDIIDANLLEFFLKEEFLKRNITNDFEYGIYDCQSEKMVYGNYISLDNKAKDNPNPTKLPVWDKENYYFGVYFPNRDTNLVSQLGIWLFSTGVLVFVFVFMLVAMFMILRQKRLSEIQKDFVNNMTHEFKTPLSTIMVSAEVLKNQNIQKNPERVKKYASLILSESNRLKTQIERVLQMSADEKDMMKLKLETIEVNHLLQEIITSFEPMVKDKSGKIFFRSSPNALTIKGDLLHISNVVFNLLDNALKYSQEKPEINISLVDKGKWIELVFTDNGLGIEKAHQTKIFDKFYRIPTGNIHNVKGFGLGLSYVKNIVKAHKGKIRLESIAGKGSTFYVDLPKA